MTPRVALLTGLLALVAPLGAAWWYAHVRWGSRGNALLALVGPAGLTVAAFWAGPWSFTSVYLRYVPPLALIAAAVWGIAPPGGRARRVWPIWVFAAAGIALAGLALRGFHYSGAPVRLWFPLRDGTYAVIQGGNSVLMNPFHGSDVSGRYALDLVKINRLGARGRRVIPARLTDYEVFGATVYSPCPGTVAQAAGDLADNRPGTADGAHPPGNHVLLRCGEAWVFLAHLQHGSPTVHAGDRVWVGEPLGRVGNSGNTSEPHLHVQGTQAPEETDPLRGQPVPLLFDGRFLVVNSVVVR